MKISTFLGTALGALLFTGVASADVQTYTATLTGAQETPANASTATATATFVYDTEAKTFTGTVNDVTGTTATSAHIYTAACGVQGSAGVGLYRSLSKEDAGAGMTGFSSNDMTQLDQDQLDSLTGGDVYVQIESADYPEGEIRGQFHLEGSANTCTGGTADAGTDSGTSTGSGNDAGTDTSTGSTNNTTTVDDSGCNTSGGGSSGSGAAVALGLGLAAYGLSRRRKNG